jgi:hypothetical protein
VTFDFTNLTPQQVGLLAVFGTVMAAVIAAVTGLVLSLVNRRTARLLALETDRRDFRKGIIMPAINVINRRATDWQEWFELRRLGETAKAQEVWVRLAKESWYVKSLMVPARFPKDSSMFEIVMELVKLDDQLLRDAKELRDTADRDRSQPFAVCQLNDHSLRLHQIAADYIYGKHYRRQGRLSKWLNRRFASVTSKH